MRYDKQEHTGEFTISLSLDLGEVSLDNSSVMQFYFVEDIFSYCVTGKLIFTDQRGIFEFGPLTGNERVNISYGEDSDIEKSFFIYKLSNVDQHSQVAGGTKEVIEIFFVDQMFYQLNFFQFSKSWIDKKTSTIIIDIADKFLGVRKWGKKELSKDNISFYSPYWTPNTCISWLMKRARGINSNNPGYLFYNNSIGTNLVTHDTLLNQNSRMKISNNDDGIYVFEDLNLYLYNKILSWNISGIDSISLNYIAGGTRFGYDSSQKLFLEKEYTYNDTIKKHTILGNKTLFPDYSNKQTKYINFQEKTETLIDNLYGNHWRKKYDLQQTLGIVVRGHENRYCGGLIEIIWPSKNMTTEIYNKNLAGYHLIKSITHSFSSYSTPAYKQKMVLIKNGYEDSDAIELVKSTKKNIYDKK